MLSVNDIKVICEETFNKAGYDFNTKHIEVAINGRLTTTLGRCMYHAGAGRAIPYRIEISRQMLETTREEDIVNVIRHECCHALVAIETGESHHHDKVFKEMCSRVGTPLDSRSSHVERIVDEASLFKYYVRCSCCNQIVGKYQKAGKVVKEFNCYQSKCCKAPLKVERNF